MNINDNDDEPKTVIPCMHLDAVGICPVHGKMGLIDGLTTLPLIAWRICHTGDEYLAEAIMADGFTTNAYQLTKEGPIITCDRTFENQAEYLKELQERKRQK